MKYVIAAALFAVSIASAVFSAIMSFKGLSVEFPTIPFVGGIGAVIALTTVAISAATAQARKQAQFRLFWSCLALMVAACLLDFGANTTATAGAVDGRQVAYDQALSAYTTAKETLAGVRADIAQAEEDLETVLGPDVEAAQLVLVSYGKEIEVDGKRGRNTNKALASFGRDLRSDLKDMRTTEENAAAIVSAGLPESSSSSDLMFAILLAAMMTILSSSTSFIASALLGGEEIDLDELEGRIDAGLENVTQIEGWLDSKAA